jgi:glyoxylase-like metal-dependent hydrolase (beta-lactamase superfamily II)
MLFDTRWDRKGPRVDVPIDRWLEDYDSPSIAGYSWRVNPTPCVSYGAVSLTVEHHGKTLAFTGDLLHSSGKVNRLAPLQYVYNDAMGVKNVYSSTVELAKLSPDFILPSCAGPISEPKSAIEKLQSNLQEYYRFIYGPQADLSVCSQKQVTQVLPWLYRSTVAATETYFVIGKSGKVACIDYGYHNSFPAPMTRDLAQWRPLLHSIPDLEAELGRKGIDAFIITHHHDDHVSGVPLLQRLYNPEVFAANELIDILAQPHAYDQQCLWHRPIQAKGKQSGVWHAWDGLRFRFDPISGHSRYSSLVTFDNDGVTVCHIGDQFLWRGGKGFNYASEAHFFSNHVYLNGPCRGDYQRFVGILKEHNPSLVLTGHSEPQTPDAIWYTKLEEGAKRWDELHERLMPLADSDPHGGVSSEVAKMSPYRTFLNAPAPFALRVHVTNPLNKAADVVVQLVGPQSWHLGVGKLLLTARGEGEIELRCVPSANTRCRRTPLTLKVTVDGQPWGELAEALVTIAYPQF